MYSLPKFVLLLATKRMTPNVFTRIPSH